MDGARRVKDIEKYTSLLPFFGTDYGLCTLIKPQITFDKDLEEIPFNELMRNYTKSIKPGIQLGKENGLSILLDAEVSHSSEKRGLCLMKGSSKTLQNLAYLMIFQSGVHQRGYGNLKNHQI